jgi:phosphate transport system permease protein
MISPRTANKLSTVFLWLIALFMFAILLVILGYILVQGLPGISLEFLTQYPKDMGREGGILPAIVGTIYFTLVSLIIAVPLGVGAAIYTTEYLSKGRLANLISFATEVLAGVPSIVFGLFGFAFFVIYLMPLTGGWSVLSGSLTAACMVLPTLLRASEEAIRAVPGEYREGSFALGANKIQTIFMVVLPSALPGILTAVILSIGRVIGETAALLLTLGGSLRLPTSLFEPARTLSLHLYLVAMEVGAMDKAFATGAVLIIVILLINFLANWGIGRLIRRQVGR